MIRVIQFGVLALWAGWLFMFTASTDVLIMRAGPADYSHRGPGYPKHGIACTYFTTLGMTTRFYEVKPGAAAPPPACPGRLWHAGKNHDAADRRTTG